MLTGRLPAPPSPSQTPILTDFFLHISTLNKTISFSARLAALEQHQHPRAWTRTICRSRALQRGRNEWACFSLMSELNSPTHKDLPQAHTPTPEGKWRRSRSKHSYGLNHCHSTRIHLQTTVGRGLLSKKKLRSYCKAFPTMSQGTSLPLWRLRGLFTAESQAACGTNCSAIQHNSFTSSRQGDPALTMPGQEENPSSFPETLT